MAVRSRLLREQTPPKLTVAMYPSQWHVVVGVLKSAQSIMESAVHAHAVQRVLDEIESQASVVASPVKASQSHEETS